MTIEADLYKRLKDFSGLAALVSTRIYPDEAPQNATRPYIVAERISTQRWQAISGVVVAAAPRFVLSSYADTWPELVDVSTQLRAAVLAMADDTVTLYERSLEDENGEFDAEAKLFRRDLEIRLLHSE